MINLTTKSWEQDMRNRMMVAKNRYYREIRRNRELLKTALLYICLMIIVVFAVVRL